MGHILVSKDEIRNAILAAHQATAAAAARSLYPNAVWLDGYRAALETVAMALGVYVRLPEAWEVLPPESAALLERGPAERLVVIEKEGK